MLQKYFVLFSFFCLQNFLIFTFILIFRNIFGRTCYGATVPWIMVFFSFSSRFESICNLESNIVRIGEASKAVSFFWRWKPWIGIDKPIGIYLLPNKKPLDFNMVDWKCLVHLDTSQGVDSSYHIQINESVRRVLFEALVHILYLTESN